MCEVMWDVRSSKVQLCNEVKIFLIPTLNITGTGTGTFESTVRLCDLKYGDGSQLDEKNTYQLIEICGMHRVRHDEER